MGFLGWLTSVFVTLKLAEIGTVATWSYWAVLSPLWIPLAVFLVVVMVVCICAGIVALFTK